jgi:hypothetical protein
MKVVFHNARIIDGGGNVILKSSVVVEDGRIVKISPQLDPSGYPDHGFRIMGFMTSRGRPFYPGLSIVMYISSMMRALTPWVKFAESHHF